MTIAPITSKQAVPSPKRANARWKRPIARGGSDHLSYALDALPDPVSPLALSLNENPFRPLPAVRSALVASIGAANRYPEFLPERLRSLIAGRVGVRDEQVVIGVGATGVIAQALRAVTNPGDKILVPVPTYDGYPIAAEITRLICNPVPLDQFGHHNLDDMADAASDARVAVLCRPHNPTGTIESAADVEQFLRRVPTDTVVILDEAYVEFLAPEHRIDAPRIVEQFPNVIVVRTFSKAYGLAGLRIGYAFCAPDLARKLWSMQLPFSICITSLAAVAASYDADAQLQQRIRKISVERRYLQMRLRAMGIYTTDSHANFVYLPADGRPWRDIFEGSGLQIRHYPDGAARIAVGARPSSRAVVSALGRSRDAH